MIEAEDLLESIHNYISALCYTYHIDDQDMWSALDKYSKAESNRLDALDPDRNK